MVERLVANEKVGGSSPLRRSKQEMPERQIPQELYRVTVPSQLSIVNGFFQPHNPNSEYGLSLPMVAKPDLLRICLFFGGKDVLKKTGDTYSLILTFNLEKLRDVKPVNSQSLYEEYYGVACLEACTMATQFTWKAREEIEEAWDDDSLEMAINLIGTENLARFIQP